MLGRSLLPALEARGHTVRALSRTAHASIVATASVEPVDFDLLASDAATRLLELLDGCDVAIHAATAIPKEISTPGAWDANTRLRVEGTVALLSACAKCRVRRYLQQSITMAYPDCGEQWVTEPTALDSSASRSSIAGPVLSMEQAVRSVPVRELEWSILRGASFIGPGTFEKALLSRVKARNAPIVNGGVNYIALVHVEDMAQAVVAAVEGARAGSIYNVNAEPIRQRDYLNGLAERLGALPPLEVDGFPVPSFRCSTEAIAADLGWRATHGIWPAATRRAELSP